MAFVVDQFQLIMLASGLLTLSLLYAALAPRAALGSTFGEVLEDPLAEIMVRNWGALTGLVGLLLIWGAFHPADRLLILGVAAASKLVFIGVVLSNPLYLRKAALTVVVDLVMVVAFAIYLLGVWVPAAPGP